MNYGEKVIIEFDVYKNEHDLFFNQRLEHVTSDNFHASETLHVLQKWTDEYGSISIKQINKRKFEIIAETVKL